MTVQKALIPVAGLGTRFLPATLATPKVMIPVIDKPPVHFCVEEASLAGIDHTVLVVSPGQESIAQYFNRRLDLESALVQRGKDELAQTISLISQMSDVSVVVQEKQLGLGHAVLSAEGAIGNNPFAVFLPDDLILSESPTIRQMVDISEKNEGMVIALKKVPDEDLSQLGVAEVKNTKKRISEIMSLVEKPSIETAPSNLAVIGRYILTKEIFDSIRDLKPGALGEIQLTDGIASLLGKIPCSGYEFEGEHFDVGIPLGMLKASVYMGIRRRDLKSKFTQWISDLS